MSPPIFWAIIAFADSRDIKKVPPLRGKTVVNLFYEDSTRTRISFELAAKRLSADVINFAAKGSSVSKGESLKDTAQTLEAMGAEAVVARHHASGAAQNLAEAGWITTPSRYLAFKHEVVSVRNAQGVPKAWISRRIGGDQIDYADEKQLVRDMFASELAKNGLEPRMDEAYKTELETLPPKPGA